jgi:cysteinyl-tRNA synthetase
MNTAGAIAVLHRMALPRILREWGEADPKKKEVHKSAFLANANLLGLLLARQPINSSIDLSAQADRLAVLRTAAMASKDFSAVDALKSALIAAGVEVRMSKAGVELVPGPDFDPAKLEALK